MCDYGCMPTLYRGSGRVASVYLRLAPEAGDTGGELPLRWRALRARLEANGADERLVKPLDDRVRAVNPSDRTLAMFARDGAVEFAAELDECDGDDAASVGPVPLGVPLLRWRQQWVPCVTAVVDRAGADLTSYDGDRESTGEVVVGPDDEIERNAPGGWAQSRYQHRAEDSWAHNAANVAVHIARRCAAINARLVLVAGDVRAVQLVTDHLPDNVRKMHRTVRSGLVQSTPGRVELPPATLRALVHEAAAAERARVVATFDDALANKDAVAGVDDTLEAARRSSIGHLLVVHRPDDSRTAWVAPDPMWLSSEEQPPRDGNTAEPVSLVEALVRAAFAQSADVTVVDPGEADLAEGVGALVRF